MDSVTHMYPHAVHVGAGTLNRVLAQRPPCLIYDPAVPHKGLADYVHAHPDATRIAPGTSEISEICDLATWIGRQSATEILAVGGGTVLDSVKLATILGDIEHVEARIARLAPRVGALPLRLDTPRPQRMCAAVTTLGTGSEVSASSSVRLQLPDGTHANILVTDPHLAPENAVLDPELTQTLPIQMQIQGLFEVFVRVVGADVGSISTLSIASPESRFMSSQVAQLLDAATSVSGLAADQLLRAAMICSQTHLGWALYGRPPAPSPLWVVADEVSSYLQITKLAATTLLFPAWAQAVCSGCDRWGDAERLASHDVVVERGLYTSEDWREQLERWGLNAAPASIPANAIAPISQRIIRRWGRGPLMRGLTTSDLSRLFESISS